jgi:hypothetical protein
MLEPNSVCCRLASMRFDIESLLLDTVPPDEELVDLIEWAFLEGQIDGSRADLAYLWLMQKMAELR